MAQLETRLRRREQELSQVVSEGRSAAKLERARLEALHAAELREKDGQLVRFQQELEQLVLALRQWQYAAQQAGGEAGAGAGAGAGSPAQGLGQGQGPAVVRSTPVLV